MTSGRYDTSPTALDMRGDVVLALSLASSRPTGEAADALRDRLRSHIAALLAPVEAYAVTVADHRSREVAEATIRHAKELLPNSDGDPATTLRLLAKVVDYLRAYALAAQQHSSGR